MYIVEIHHSHLLEMRAQESNHMLPSRLLGPPSSSVMQRGSGQKYIEKRIKREMYILRSEAADLASKRRECQDCGYFFYESSFFDVIATTAYVLILGIVATRKGYYLGV